MAELDLPTEDVYITHIDSPSKFFVVNGQKLPMLDRIWQEIEKEMQKTSSQNPSENWLQPQIINAFTPCIASWNGRWYRARVLARRPDGNFEVEYVDYGNIETVEPNAVKTRPLNPLINCTETLACPCRLSGDISRMDKKRFEEICAEVTGQFKMKIDNVDDDTGQYMVTLFVQDDNRQLKNVNATVMCASSPPTLVDGAMYLSGSPILGRRTYIGPMDSRIKKPGTNANVHGGSGELASAMNQYPLIDLSEEPPLLADGAYGGRAGDSRDSHFVRRATPRFVTDLDAVLDGPAETDDEDDENVCAKKVRSALDKGRQRIQGRASGMIRANEGRTWSMSSDSEQSLSAEDDMVKALRAKWAHLLSLRYGRVKAPPPGSLSAEQQVTINRVISPTDFYAQTVQQRNGLRRLETTMEEELSPDQMSIPVQLIEPGLCCGVYSEFSKTWRRGQIVRVERDMSAGPPNVFVDVHLVDTGFERRFPATAIKPINDHLTTYLPMVFHAKLAQPHFEGIQWRPEDIETFRQMVDNRMLMMKFMTNSLPLFEAELVDMMHNCQACSSRMKKCTVNELMMQWIQRNGGLASRM